eukprot:TRINITY_DN1580_c0_g2_i1.p1 TRINITY_DN1580_c0_g2~~TRINITY_DN1580_c0_g2_i1.p1  ORF type:complete len:797 (-),score=198.66 TRINITY_DN1580_c0_g2_i1:180-2570(-)
MQMNRERIWACVTQLNTEIVKYENDCTSTVVYTTEQLQYYLSEVVEATKLLIVKLKSCGIGPIGLSRVDEKDFEDICLQVHENQPLPSLQWIVSKIKFVNALRLAIEKQLVKNESSKQLKESEDRYSIAVELIKERDVRIGTTSSEFQEEISSLKTENKRLNTEIRRVKTQVKINAARDKKRNILERELRAEIFSLKKEIRIARDISESVRDNVEAKPMKISNNNTPMKISHTNENENNNCNNEDISRNETKEISDKPKELLNSHYSETANISNETSNNHPLEKYNIPQDISNTIDEDSSYPLETTDTTDESSEIANNEPEETSNILGNLFNNDNIIIEPIDHSEEMAKDIELECESSDTESSLSESSETDTSSEYNPEPEEANDRTEEDGFLEEIFKSDSIPSRKRSRKEMEEEDDDNDKSGKKNNNTKRGRGRKMNRVSMLERVLVPSPPRVPLEKQCANILCTRAAIPECPLDYKKWTSNSLKEGNEFLCNVDFKAQNGRKGKNRIKRAMRKSGRRCRVSLRCQFTGTIEEVEAHEIEHLKQLPWKCVDCDKRYKDKLGVIQHHRNIHEALFVCCGHSFSSHQWLHSHMEKNHGSIEGCYVCTRVQNEANRRGRGKRKNVVYVWVGDGEPPKPKPRGRRKSSNDMSDDIDNEDSSDNSEYEVESDGDNNISVGDDHHLLGKRCNILYDGERFVAEIDNFSLEEKSFEVKFETDGLFATYSEEEIMNPSICEFIEKEEKTEEELEERDTSNENESKEKEVSEENKDVKPSDEDAKVEQKQDLNTSEYEHDKLIG